MPNPYPFTISTQTLGGMLDEATLHETVVADDAIATPLVGVNRTGRDTLSVQFENDLPRAEEARLREIVASHDPDSLEVTKQTIATRIDHVANRRIALGPGFEWPAASGKLFSLSLPAQIKWLGLYNARNFIAYPLTVRTKDNCQEHSITDAAEVEAIYQQIVTLVRAELDRATDAKKAVMESTTKADIRIAANTYLGT